MSRSRGDEVVTDVAGPVVSRTRHAPEVSYRSFLAAGETPRIHWASPRGLELTGVGAAASIATTSRDRFDAVREATTRLFDSVDHQGPAETRPRLLGGFSFTADHTADAPWHGFDRATFVLPEVQLTSHGNETWVTVHATDTEPSIVEEILEDQLERLEELPAMRADGDPPGVASTHRTPDRSGWREQVASALEQIEEGRLQKVVLAQRLQATLAGELSIPDILERVRRSYDDCFRFLLEPTTQATFFGAPPERLLRRQGQAVDTEALAGSVSRGETPEEDAELADRLREDQKLRVEQSLVAETIEAALSPLGEVSVGDREIRRLSNIQHLRTPIEVTLDADTHVLDLVEALHPTPAVGGVPPAAALETIRETETFDRGWYAAPVGWLDARGDGEFAVGIRAAVATAEAASLYAGNGIVAESNADAEWAELQQKYRPILDELR